ncbi:MAG: AraC family transcriptional regulator [Bacteroidetes bacterium]|jgi:effector-binding domain-containing protein|nr:AraC family transcriptional regulator [Bacteroidota bacterium]
MNKKILRYFTLTALIAVIVLGVWYFTKPYDYTVTFESKTLPGTINQSLKLWVKSLDNSKIIESNSINNIKQNFNYNDNSYTYNWILDNKHDSLTKVTVDITGSKSNISNRIAHIFKNTKLKQRSKDNIHDFMTLLQSHLESHDVKIIGEAMSPEVYCAYLSFQTEQMLKANEMMKSYNYLSTELLKNKIELQGNPMVEITRWDKKKDSIYFNFCFPIVEIDSLPKHPKIKFKTIKSQKSIKAIYHGNYISSDRAWYKLLHYAENENIKLNSKPIEVFHNNPMYGREDRNWKTEIYMPIKE